MNWEEIIKWSLRGKQEDAGTNPSHGGKKAAVDDCKATNCRSNHNNNCVLVKVSVDYNGKCEMFHDKKYEQGAKPKSGSNKEFHDLMNQAQRDRERKKRGY